MTGAAGIPAEHRQAKSKTALALEMVRHQRALGVRFAWVGVDGGYGKEPEFLRAVEDLGETFVADVHKNQRIYLVPGRKLDFRWVPYFRWPENPGQSNPLEAESDPVRDD